MTEERNINTNTDNKQIRNCGIVHMSGGEINGQAKIAGVINEAQQQQTDLAQAAAEIQELLKQLDKSYPTDIRVGKMKLMKQIKNNPSLAPRILSALKAGSVSALEQFLNHPASSFIITALEDWKKTNGS